MAESDELLGQPCDYPFGSAVQFRGHAFGQRSDLRNAHAGLSARNKPIKCRRRSVSVNTDGAFSCLHDGPSSMA